MAACWSPRSPATEMPASVPFASPYTSDDDRIWGSIDLGTPIAEHRSSSQSRVSRFISIVREALVTSVTCTPPSVPPVRFQMHQVSMLPNTRSPASASARAPSTLSRIQRTLVPEKYVASGRPVFSRNRF